MLQVDKETFEKKCLRQKATCWWISRRRMCACEALMPAIESLSEKYGDKIKFTKLNTSKARRLAISQKVLDFL